MSRREKKVDLRLNLAPPPSRDAPPRMAGEEAPPPSGDAPPRMAGEEAPRVSSLTPSTSPLQSPANSCVSSEEESPAASMVLAVCPRCLMYVMLSEDFDAKCPKCKSAVLLDFLRGGVGASSPAAKKNRNI